MKFSKGLMEFLLCRTLSSASGWRVGVEWKKWEQTWDPRNSKPKGWILAIGNPQCIPSNCCSCYMCPVRSASNMFHPLWGLHFLHRYAGITSTGWNGWEMFFWVPPNAGLSSPLHTPHCFPDERRWSQQGEGLGIGEAWTHDVLPLLWKDKQLIKPNSVPHERRRHGF